VLRPLNGKRAVSSINSAGKTRYLHAKDEGGPLPYKRYKN
jgi:hypothetical protein